MSEFTDYLDAYLEVKAEYDERLNLFKGDRQDFYERNVYLCERYNRAKDRLNRICEQLI